MYQDMLDIPAGQKPSFGDNLRFMFTHQLGNMYTRYLLWNFIGRENDLEGAYAISNPFEDTSKLPDVLKNNKARNNYYYLPIILVLLGFYLLYRKDEKDFLVTIMMFVLSGIALAVYLNSPPAEPRERDYIYVGSFYFLAIWAGLGVMQLAEWLTKLVKSPQVRWGLLGVLSFSAPAILAQQNWDDHDRSGRYHQIDFAKNLLNSCAPNAILFTGGDNDTFPLWYVQEVEGFRTDVRVCNLSLLGTDWYIDQMKRKTYESDALPIGLKKDQFLEGVNDQIMFNESPNISSMSLPDFLDLLHRDSPSIQAQTQSGEMINTFPSDSLTIPVNVAQVANSAWFPKEFTGFLTDQLAWRLPSKNIFKGELIQLEIVANNAQQGWKRPIYFASTLPGDQYLGLKESMQLEGYAYRLMPFKITGAKDGFVNSKIMADNMLNKMYWRGLNDDKIYYHGDFYMGIPSVTLRLNTYRLADQLIREGNIPLAKKVLNQVENVMPDKVIPYDQFTASMVSLFIEVGETKKALSIAKTMMDRNDKALDYYLSGGIRSHDRDIQIAYYEMTIIASTLSQSKLPVNQYQELIAKFLKWKNVFDPEK
jgi:hypothetical protein